MEITRKTQNKITELLINKSISEKDAMELSNQICDLLEGEQVINMSTSANITYQVDNQLNTYSLKSAFPNIQQEAELPTPGERVKLVPGTKMKGGYVNTKGQFVPADMTCKAGVLKEDGTVDMDLTRLG